MDLKQSQVEFSLNAACLVNYELYFLGGKPYSFMDSNYLFQYNTLNKSSHNWLIKNDIPLYTLKPTMNYNPNNHSLVLFGGQTEFQSLMGTIFEITLKDITCTEIFPKNSSAMPRERYGHCAEFRHPYLIIFGGRSLVGPQNDLWAFNFESYEWTELKRASKAEISPRYFFGSAIEEDILYVFGGLNGEEECYTSPFDSKCVLSDLLKIQLKGFCQDGQTNSLEWRSICKEIPYIGKNFGCNVEYVQGKFVFFRSIIDSLTNPNNEIIYYDPRENQTTYCLDHLPLRPEDDFYFQCRIDNCILLTSLTHRRGSNYCINLLIPQSFDFVFTKGENPVQLNNWDCHLSKCFNFNKYKQCRQYRFQELDKMVNQAPQTIEQLQNLCEHVWISLQNVAFARYSKYVQSKVEQPTILLVFEIGKIMAISYSAIKQRSKYFSYLFHFSQRSIESIQVNESLKRMNYNCIGILNVYIHTGRLILPNSLTIGECKNLIQFGQYYLIQGLAEICSCKLFSVQSKENYLSLIKFAQKNRYQDLEQHLWNQTLQYFIVDERERQIIENNKINNCCLSQMLDNNRFYFLQKIAEINQASKSRTKK